jgi:hypothetical protein
VRYRRRKEKMDRRVMDIYSLMLDKSLCRSGVALKEMSRERLKSLCDGEGKGVQELLSLLSFLVEKK